MLTNKIHSLCSSGCDLEMNESLSTVCGEISVVIGTIFLNKLGERNSLALKESLEKEF